MSSDEHSAKNIVKKAKKDDEKRDFICGCSKKYLSYPALYTHIKTKHGGHEPKGTQKMGPGIPQKIKISPQSNLLARIQKEVSLDDLEILNTLERGPIQQQDPIPCANRIKKQYGKQLYAAYTKLMKANYYRITKAMPLSQALAIYLLGVANFVSQQLYRYHVQFAKNFLYCFRDHLQEIYQTCFKRYKLTKVSTDNCLLAPLISDFFVRFYAPQHIPDYNEETKNIMELITRDFCKWLRKKKLTIVSINSNANSKLPPKMDFSIRQWPDKNYDEIGNKGQMVKKDHEYFQDKQIEEENLSQKQDDDVSQKKDEDHSEKEEEYHSEIIDEQDQRSQLGKVRREKVDINRINEIRNQIINEIDRNDGIQMKKISNSQVEQKPAHDGQGEHDNQHKDGPYLDNNLDQNQ